MFACWDVPYASNIAGSQTASECSASLARLIAEKLSRKMLELAEKGNVRCLEYCLDRLLPKRSGRSLDIQLPAIKNVHDVVLAMAAITTAVSNGHVTAEEASHLVNLLNSYDRAITTSDVVIRLEKLESRMKKKF